MKQPPNSSTSQYQASSIRRNRSKPSKAAKFIGTVATEEEAVKASAGGKAIPGPGASKSSGFGGPGLEGIVGSEDSVGEGAMVLPPGVGNNGVMSGDRLGADVEGKGALGKNAGAADIVENCACVC